MSVLNQVSQAILSGSVKIVDLTHTLDPDFPVLVLPPEFGQCQPFRIEEVSRYDERGPAGTGAISAAMSIRAPILMRLCTG